MKAVIADGECGFSKLELVLVITVFSLCAGLFAMRFRYLQESAEKTAMELTIMNMRAGLRYQQAELMMENRMRELPALLNENPVSWLQKPPVNYVGEIANPDDEKIRPGNWFYDVSKKELVYKLNLNDHFTDFGYGDSEIRFKVMGIVQKSRQGNVETQTVMSVKLVPVAEFAWF